MRIKRFRAKDLPGVVALIKSEFGLNAVILSQRENPETGETEVTAGVREEDLAPIKDVQGQGSVPGNMEAPDPQPSGRPPTPSGRPPKGALGPSDAARRYGSSGGVSPGETPGSDQASKLSPSEGGSSPSFSDLLSQSEAIPLGEAMREGTTPGAGGAGPGRVGAGPGRVGEASSQTSSHGRAPLGPAPEAKGGALAARDLKPASVAAGPRRMAATPAMGIASYKRSEEKVLESVGTAALEKSLSDLREEMGERLFELKSLLLDLAHRQGLSEKWRDKPELIGLYRKLLGTGLDQDLARSYVEMAAESRDAWGGELIESLKKSVLPSLKVLSPERDKGRFLALTGPSGGGKTHAVMKLAALYKQKGLKVALISLDTIKLGASEQLTRFARIMGLGLKVCQNKGEFREARELFSDADKVLVDTSARDILSPPSNKDMVGTLAESGVFTLLALPANLKSEDLISNYEAARGPFLTGVVLTKLDETLKLGNVFNFVKQSGPIFAYFSLGLKSPEDFRPANPEKLLDLWLK